MLIFTYSRIEENQKIEETLKKDKTKSANNQHMFSQAPQENSKNRQI